MTNGKLPADSPTKTQAYQLQPATEDTPHLSWCMVWGGRRVHTPTFSRFKFSSSAFFALAGVFSRLAQKAGKLGARVVLINRRGYPPSKPFSDEERTLLVSSADDTVGDRLKVDDFVKGLARELYDFLLHLVSAGDIPSKSITLAGWSLGALWMAAFLAHAPSFPATNVALHQYFRRVIAYGALPSFVFLILLRAYHLRPGGEATRLPPPRTVQPAE